MPKLVSLSGLGSAGLALGICMFLPAGEASAQLRKANPRPPVVIKPTPLASQQATIANAGGPIGGVGPLAANQFGAVGAGTGAANNLAGSNQGASAFTGTAPTTGGAAGAATLTPTNANYLGYNGMQGPVPRLTAANPNAVSAANQTGALGVGTGLGGFGSPLSGGIGGLGGGGLGGLGGFGGGGLGGFGGGGLGGFGGGGLGGFGSPFGGLGGGLPGLGGGFIL